MNLYSKTKIGNKRIINILGIKITYHKKQNIPSPTRNNHNYRYYPVMGYPLLLYNLINADKFSIADKRRICERRMCDYGNKYFPDIENPKTFNEKIQWLNLYWHNPLITRCTDKCTFKEYLHETIGDEYTVPTIGIYNDVHEIDFDNLPNEYVIKSNWGGDSTQVLLKKEKTKISNDEIKKVVNYWMLPYWNLYGAGFSWGYKDIKPKIIIEELLKPKNGIVLDYKVMCFNGEPKYTFVVYDRRENMALDFFDMDWNKIDLRRMYKNAKTPAEKPKNFDKMIEIAKKLSKPFPFVRVDFYDIDGKLYVGELTFAPGGGLEPFEPVEWDYKFGELITLPEKWLDERDFE